MAQPTGYEAIKQHMRNAVRAQSAGNLAEAHSHVTSAIAAGLTAHDISELTTPEFRSAMRAWKVGPR